MAAQLSKEVKLVLILMLLSSAARADKTFGEKYAEVWSPPTVVEYVAHAGSESLIFLDIWQSMDIKNHQDVRMFESNPLFFDKHPSDLKLLTGGMVFVTATTMVWYVLPPQVRWIVNGAIVYVELPQVLTNKNTWHLKLTIPFG